ncbi:response regulator transcription factor [Streptomyces phaeofaciens JCM 4814]|uniref:DNA-binding response regulator n=2 Tax=Streptomyces phaeofaciens TaxID=68254 RepID=A0A918HNK8_9ACTN|nr:DNA-binding response regulator [Streptomyces phaeofaciens]
MLGAIGILRSASGCRFIGSLGGIDELTENQEESDGCVLVVDPYLDGVPFPDALSEVTKRHPVLVMSARTGHQNVRRALQSGAHGYVSKDIDSSTLVTAVQAVGIGGVYLGLSVADVLMQEWGGAPPPDFGEPLKGTDLTPREQDVLTMVARGLTHKQIGTRLTLSKATVDTYVHRIRQKVGAFNKAGLTRVAMDMGLLSNHS